MRFKTTSFIILMSSLIFACPGGSIDAPQRVGSSSSWQYVSAYTSGSGTYTMGIDNGSLFGFGKQLSDRNFPALGR